MTTTLTPTAAETAPGAAVAIPAPSLVRDPICGMEFDPAGAAAMRTLGGETKYFCAERCAREFDRRRARQAGPGAAGDEPPAPADRFHETAPASAAYAAGPGLPRWLLPAASAAVLVAVMAVTVFGVSMSTLLVYGVIVLCPLMHLFMMRGHGAHATHTEKAKTDSEDASTANGSTTRRSCH